MAGLRRELPAPAPLSRRQRAVVVWIAAFCAASRFLALAASFWDWDEALFLLGMRDYDVTQHHPHPPGFPLYIGAARLVRFVTGDDFRALQGLNLVAAMLVFPAVFLFARELRFRFETAVIAGAVFAFLPNVWFFGGTAFSDVPSVVLALFAATLLLQGRTSRNAYWFGALLMALAIGIRPQNLLIGLVPGVLATVRRRPHEIAVALLVGVAVSGGAFAGAIHATGSYEDYARVVREHADYISRVDSWRSPVRPPLWRLAHLFFARQYQSPVFGVLATLLVIVSAVGSVRERSRPMLLAVLTFGPFAILAWLMLDRFSVSRFSIGYQPMFAILVADGIRRVAARLAARGGARLTPLRAEIALAALVAGGFAVYALPALSVVRSGRSPTLLAARAVREHVERGADRLYVAHSMSKFADLVVPELPYTRVIDDRALPLSDPPRAWILAEITSTPEEGFVFSRERGHLWNIARRNFFRVKLAPLTARARFGAGWLEPEGEGIHEWRWMGRQSATDLPAGSGTMKLRMHLDVPAEVVEQSPTITVRVNGTVVEAFRPATSMFEKNYDVTPAAGGPNRLELSIDKTTPGDDARAMKLRYLAWGPT